MTSCSVPLFIFILKTTVVLTLTFSEGRGERETILVQGVKAPGAQVLSRSLGGYLVSRKERKPNPFVTLETLRSSV